MGAQVLLISIVPTEALETAIWALKTRYPGVRVTALVGAVPPRNADEVIAWPGLGVRRLRTELRRRQFTVAAVVHGGDQYLRRGFWKAVLVALLSGAQGKALVRPPGRRAIRPLSGPELLLAGAAGVAGRLLAEACVVLLMAPLLLILAGIVATDLSEALSGAGRKVPRKGQKVLSSGPNP